MLWIETIKLIKENSKRGFLELTSSNIQYDEPIKKNNFLFCHICLVDINKSEEYNEHDRLTLCNTCYKNVLN